MVESTVTILGKRKIRRENENLVVGTLSHPLVPPDTKLLPPESSTSTKVPATRGHRCTYPGCEKAYSKPSRLEEHERSHSGQRPFVCKTCGKSYLRETHLHAHARSHLPNEMKPFTCEKAGCRKKFWTSQHLRVHLSSHDGAKPYQCQETGCGEAFAKHHQLRSHICASHAPPGTKPYRCEHEGCTNSFKTNQHLRSHQKIHDGKRYTCSHTSCLSGPENGRRYFSTWSSLQSHIKKDHPPTCPHSSCKGKTFSNAGNLRVHLRLHEQRQAEAALQTANETDCETPMTKKRRGGEYGREWKCQINDCGKDYKSIKALRTHINVEHQGRRDFSCTHDDCTRAFGHKHLLRRHLAKVHPSENSRAPSASSEDEEAWHDSEDDFNIDLITGNLYVKQAEANLKTSTVLRCPYPELDGLVDPIDPEAQESTAESIIPPICVYVFSRAYDLRRHLGATHNVVVAKEVVDKWVIKKKQASIA